METTSRPQGDNMWSYKYGLTLGAVLHMKDLCSKSCLDREGINASTEMGRVDPAQGKTGLPTGKLYRGRTHIWDHQEGITTYGAPSIVQGLTEWACAQVLGLASDASCCV